MVPRFVANRPPQHAVASFACFTHFAGLWYGLGLKLSATDHAQSHMGIALVDGHAFF